MLQPSVIRLFCEAVPQNFFCKSSQTDSFFNAEFVVIESLLNLADFFKELRVVRSQILKPIQVSANEKCQQVSERNQIVPTRLLLKKKSISAREQKVSRKRDFILRINMVSILILPALRDTEVD